MVSSKRPNPIGLPLVSPSGGRAVCDGRPCKQSSGLPKDLAELWSALQLISCRSIETSEVCESWVINRWLLTGLVGFYQRLPDIYSQVKKTTCLGFRNKIQDSGRRTPGWRSCCGYLLECLHRRWGMELTGNVQPSSPPLPLTTLLHCGPGHYPL